MTRDEYDRRRADLITRFPYFLEGANAIGLEILPGWLGLFEMLCARMRAVLMPDEEVRVHVEHAAAKDGR